jgi:hypothetical protein
MKFPLLLVMLFLCVGVAGYAVVAYGFLPPGTTVAPQMKSVYAEHPVAILTHVFSSSLALLLGPWQFVPAIRRRKTLHKRLGLGYVAAVLVGGASGLVMAWLAFGGLVSQVGFGLLAVVWLYTTFRAMAAIAERRFAEHEAWAMRSFSLTMAAVTLRIYLGLGFALGLPFEQFYPVLSWLCWVPNLLLVEWFLLKKSA